ncbi:hypothetical protein IGI04_040784 [Brassica rapa subsp. trilocularis]|uniref:Malectin-like domain-containing protein n=1 Tax=Brassica rapa subsp. trilocularis TaxID=1813537 RepID=A0ABQ7KPJ7_BRACM|nr:hypothetical protein IGI04_040784 [Brassica rapa subsp. trilocularis]
MSQTDGRSYSPYFYKARLKQGSISVYHLNSFRHILEESNVYELNGFDVAKSNPTYRFDETPIQVRIPKECFRFRKYDQLMSLTNINTYFTERSTPHGMLATLKLDRAAASQRNLMHFYFDNDGGVSSNYLKITLSELNTHGFTASLERNQSSFALRSSIALTQHTDGAISHFRSATANCNVDSQLFHAMHVDNAVGVVRSSTPRVCPIQPDSDIGEELAEEKGRSPMKSPKD